MLVYRSVCENILWVLFMEAKQTYHKSSNKELSHEKASVHWLVNRDSGIFCGLNAPYQKERQEMSITIIPCTIHTTVSFC